MPDSGDTVIMDTTLKELISQWKTKIIIVTIF